MRKLVVAAWLAASSVIAAVPAAADGPVSLPPLAPGEVLLEVNGIGIARTPASHAVLTVVVRGEGATEAEARSAVQQAIAAVTAAARRAGAAPADIRTAPIEVRSDMDYSYGNAMGIDVDMNATVDTTMGEVTEISVATSTVTIRLRNAAAAPDLGNALSGQAGTSVSSTSYELEDDSAARRQARAEAVSRARADAESYAASAGMRVARVLRITERTGLDSLPMMITEQRTARRFSEGPWGQREGDGFVETYAVVGVDYALAPR